MNTKVKGFGAGVLAAVFYGTNPLRYYAGQCAVL